jgi:hypothetical protein
MPNDSRLKIPMVRQRKFMDAKLAIIPEVTAPKDRTAAERQRRYRARRKLQKAGVTVTAAATVAAATSALLRFEASRIDPRRHIEFVG